MVSPFLCCYDSIRSVSTFGNELIPTFGAGDPDLALAPGDPEPLGALGADEIPIGAVLVPLLFPLVQQAAGRGRRGGPPGAARALRGLVEELLHRRHDREELHVLVVAGGGIPGEEADAQEDGGRGEQEAEQGAGGGVPAQHEAQQIADAAGDEQGFVQFIQLQLGSHRFVSFR